MRFFFYKTALLVFLAHANLSCMPSYRDPVDLSLPSNKLKSTCLKEWSAAHRLCGQTNDLIVSGSATSKIDDSIAILKLLRLSGGYADEVFLQSENAIINDRNQLAPHAKDADNDSVMSDVSLPAHTHRGRPLHRLQHDSPDDACPNHALDQRESMVSSAGLDARDAAQLLGALSRASDVSRSRRSYTATANALTAPSHRFGHALYLTAAPPPQPVPDRPAQRFVRRTAPRLRPSARVPPCRRRLPRPGQVLSASYFIFNHHHRRHHLESIVFVDCVQWPAACLPACHPSSCLNPSPPSSLTAKRRDRR